MHMSRAVLGVAGGAPNQKECLNAELQGDVGWGLSQIEMERGCQSGLYRRPHAEVGQRRELRSGMTHQMRKPSPQSSYSCVWFQLPAASEIPSHPVWITGNCGNTVPNQNVEVPTMAAFRDTASGFGSAIESQLKNVKGRTRELDQRSGRVSP